MENHDQLCQLRCLTRKNRRFFHIKSATKWSPRTVKMKSLKSRPVLWLAWQKRFQSSSGADLAKTGLEILAFSQILRLSRSSMRCTTWTTLRTRCSIWFKSSLRRWNLWNRDLPSKKTKMECKPNRRKKRSARKPIKFKSLKVLQ